MFCLTCGAEMNAQSRSCAVCGRGGAETPPVPSARAITLAPSLAASQAGALTTAAFGGAFAPAIATGDLDAVGLPRDAIGQAILGAVAGMAVSLLVPWVAISGTTFSPAASGLAAAVLLLLLAVTASPVFSGRLRAQRAYAALPLVGGSIFLGGILTLWWACGWLSAQQVYFLGGGSGTAPVFPLTVGRAGTPATFAPQVGMLLFGAGAVVLLFAGHQFTVRARPVAPAPLVAVAPSPAVPVAPPPVVPVAPPAPGEAVASAAAAARPALAQPVLPGTEGWSTPPPAPPRMRMPPTRRWGPGG